MIIVYTDGSCRKNKKGGWAFIAIRGNHVLERLGTMEGSTSNRTELTAIIEAVKFIDKREAIIYSDSAYCVQNFYSSVPFWSKSDYKGQRGSPIKNSDLWEQLRSLMDGKSIKLKWIKARDRRSDHYEYNKWVDSLAKLASEGD